MYHGRRNGIHTEFTGRMWSPMGGGSGDAVTEAILNRTPTGNNSKINSNNSNLSTRRRRQIITCTPRGSVAPRGLRPDMMSNINRLTASSHNL
jgi:hypothetical protein